MGRFVTETVLAQQKVLNMVIVFFFLIFFIEDYNLQYLQYIRKKLQKLFW
jgi:type III secretory pathway component EscU